MLSSLRLFRALFVPMLSLISIVLPLYLSQSPNSGIIYRSLARGCQKYRIITTTPTPPNLDGLLMMGHQARFFPSSSRPTMSFSLPQPAYVLLGTFLLWRLLKNVVHARTRNLNHIPTIGLCSKLPWPLDTLFYYAGLVEYTFRCHALMKEGYKKYTTYGIFKVPAADWMCVVSNREMIEDLRKAPADTLSFYAAVDIELEVASTLGQNVTNHPYHLNVLRNQVTKNLGTLVPELREELGLSLDEFLEVPKTGEWKSVHVASRFADVLGRSANRVYVGAELCRDPGYIKLNVQHTNHVLKSAIILNMFSKLLKPAVSYWLRDVPKSIDREMKYLHRLIDDRRQYLSSTYDGSPEKPNDLLMWLMEEAKGDEQSDRNLALRVLALNFAAIHTTSMSLGHAIYHVAADADLARGLREEVEAVVSEFGWTKHSISKLVKMDSFLRESQRVNGLGSLLMGRLALKPFTFSNGVTVPVGTHLSVAIEAVHSDPTNYGDDVDEFKPLRFLACESQPLGDQQQQENRPLTSTSPEYLAWGHGSAACPGRFFASTVLKLALGQILMSYDVKTADGRRPENMRFGKYTLPNPKAEVLFRRRESV